MIRNFFLVLLFLFLMYQISFAQKVIPKDTLITLERNPGYWGKVGSESCPFYKLTIFAEGKVKLEVKEYKEYKEVTNKIIKSKIKKEQVKQIISEFEKIDFYSIKSTFEDKENIRGECPQYAYDASSAFISIAVNGKTKQVEHYDGCRGTESLSKLTNLENKIDEAVNIKQWVDCYGGKNRITLTESNTFKRVF
ncbi:MAG: DUF6438 domain-containing protein [Pyrinomonadaceae bacterium]